VRAWSEEGYAMRSMLAAMVALLVVLSGLSAVGQEKTDPNQILKGVVRIAMDSEYVVLQVDGTAWEDYYFEDDGFVLFVEEIDRSKSHTIKLTPIYEELKPVEVAVSPKAWKLVKVDKETKQWRAESQVKFPKWKPGEREKFLDQQKKAEEDAAKKAEEEAKKAEEAAKKAEEEAKKPDEGEKKPDEGTPPPEPEKAPTPDNTPAPEKTPEPEKTPAPDRAPAPEKPVEPEEAPAPEPEKTPPPEK
jgi:hypothetical protein